MSPSMALVPHPRGGEATPCQPRVGGWALALRSPPGHPGLLRVLLRHGGEARDIHPRGLAQGTFLKWALPSWLPRAGPAAPLHHLPGWRRVLPPVCGSRVRCSRMHMAGILRRVSAPERRGRPLVASLEDPQHQPSAAAEPRVRLSPWKPTLLGFSCRPLLTPFPRSSPCGFSKVRWSGRQQCQFIGLFFTLSARKVILVAAFSCSSFQGLQEESVSPISRYSLHWPSSRSFYRSGVIPWNHDSLGAGGMQSCWVCSTGTSWQA